MEDIKYRMYKDGIMIHEGNCPSLFFTSVIPMRNQNLFDYIELEWNGHKKIHNRETFLHDWKP
jgi:hypothetical protein